MKIAIIGAGWAGAAAAHYLPLHYDVHVFEASRHIGGRARGFDSQKLQRTIDNGQHLLLGAYTQSLALMQSLGINLEQAFHRFDLTIESADQQQRLKAWPLPAPLHLLGAFLSGKGFSGADKLAMLRLQRSLQRQGWRTTSGQTVLQLLQATQQTATLIDCLWQPLCLAAMNTPIELACAQLFAYVLRDSLGGQRRDSQMLIPKHNLSALWPKHALQGRTVHLGQRVERVTPLPEQSGCLVDDAYFDACLITTPPYATARLFQSQALDALAASSLLEMDAVAAWLNGLQRVKYRPIATLYLQLEQAWHEPAPMLMLHEDRSRHHYGQWLFNHQAIPDSFASPLLSVVISDADALSAHPRELVVKRIEEQLREQLQGRLPLPAVQATELIIEKRATFEATPNCFRASMQSPWPNILLAGDWVDSEYPGVLESAVRSAKHCAEFLNQEP